MQHAGRSALRLVHYWWPLAMGWSFVAVIHRATGTAPDSYGVLALLSGILAAYSADRLLDGMGQTVEADAALEHRTLVPLLTAACVGASLVCAWSAWKLPLPAAGLIPLLGAATLLYSNLKRHTVVKLVVLPTIWVWAAMALPFGDGSWLGWRTLLQPVTAPLLLLTAAGCILCDIKDEADDRQAGVRSLPAVYGRTAAMRIAASVTAIAACVALAEHRPGLVCGAAALGATTLAPSLLALDVIGPLLVDVILTLPGILISAHVV